MACESLNSPSPAMPVPEAGSQPVDRRGRLGDVGQKVFDRLDVRSRRGPGHLAIGLVGIDDPPLGVGDEQTLRHGIDEGLGQFVRCRARRDLHEADCGGKKVADADHRQHAEHAEQERVAQAFAEDAEDDGGARQDDDEDDEPGNRARPRVLVDDRKRIEVAARLSCHQKVIPELAAPPPPTG